MFTTICTVLNYRFSTNQILATSTIIFPFISLSDHAQTLILFISLCHSLWFYCCLVL